MSLTKKEIIDTLNDLSWAILELSTPEDDGFELDWRGLRKQCQDLADRVESHMTDTEELITEILSIKTTSEIVRYDGGEIYIGENYPQGAVKYAIEKYRAKLKHGTEVPPTVPLTQDDYFRHPSLK